MVCIFFNPKHMMSFIPRAGNTHATKTHHYCTARQCSPLGRKFMECYIIKPAQSHLMKHLVIGQRQNAPDFSAFHWSPRGNLVSIGQHFVHQGSTFTEKDRNKPNYRIGPLSDSVIKLVSDLITESDQAVRTVHSCNSWLLSASLSSSG